MINRRVRTLILGFLLLTIAAGCSSAQAPRTPQIRDEPANLLTPLLLRSVIEGRGQQVMPVDPVSLVELAGYAPIDFNRHYDYVTSRDGRKLAAMLHPDDSPGNPGWQLRVIDLAAWTDYVVDLDIGQMARGLTFGPDGMSALLGRVPLVETGSQRNR